MKTQNVKSNKSHLLNERMKGFGDCSNIKFRELFINLERLLKQDGVALTLVVFFISLIIGITWQNAATTSIIVAAFASIFVAMKYKLDQASYHKQLFDERFTIYTVINDALHDWASNNNRCYDEMLKKINSIIQKAYYLFGDSTYQFIKQFRRSFICLKGDEEQKIDARNHLVSLVDNENLLKKFPELKIDIY